MIPKILVVDDDPAISELLSIVLETEGFSTTAIVDGAEAIPAFHAENPDLILLDLMLPGKNGIDICREIRKESSVPIIMLTAKTDTVDVVLGLESGADDYVQKPFKTKELIARIRARLRNNEDTNDGNMRVGDLTIDLNGHTVTRDGVDLALTPIEFELLRTMAEKPGQVFSRKELLNQVWGYAHATDTRLVNVHVQRLRSKVEIDPENPQVVLTVRGVGYKTAQA